MLSGIRNVGNGLGKWDFTSQYNKSGSRNLNVRMYAPELIAGLKVFVFRLGITRRCKWI